jgi:ABC-type nitrate/sulfonate/bicarbonate transport system ATPase subunit
MKWLITWRTVMTNVRFEAQLSAGSDETRDNHVKALWSDPRVTYVAYEPYKE